jgi:phosphoglycerate kinase
MQLPADIASLEELELEGQRVLVRADLDVAVDPETGAVLDDAPLVAAQATFEHVISRGARLVIAGHRGNPAGKPTRSLSLEAVGSRLAELTGWELLLPEESVGDMPRKLVSELRPGQVCLLENLGFDPGEEQNDDTYVRELGCLCDVFVADSLGALHLAHASVVGLPRLLRYRAAGLALRRELEAFGRIAEPGTVILLGGSFARSVPLAQALLGRSAPLLLGGEIGLSLLAAQGVALGATKIDTAILAEARTFLEQARQRRAELLLPTDFVIGGGEQAPTAVPLGGVPPDGLVLDFGPRTAAEWQSRLDASETALWDGPLACRSASPEGSLAVLSALASGPGFAFVGPDAATELASLPLDPTRFGHVTRGGEAARQLLLGKKLPGLEILRGPR